MIIVPKYRKYDYRTEVQPVCCILHKRLQNFNWKRVLYADCIRRHIQHKFVSNQVLIYSSGTRYTVHRLRHVTVSVCEHPHCQSFSDNDLKRHIFHKNDFHKLIFGDQTVYERNKKAIEK